MFGVSLADPRLKEAMPFSQTLSSPEDLSSQMMPNSVKSSSVAASLIQHPFLCSIHIDPLSH